MSIRDRKIWQWIAAVCILIMMIRYFPAMVQLDLRSYTQGDPGQLMRILEAVFYVLNVIAFVLLWRFGRFSLLFAIIPIVFSTWIFNVSYWPFFLDAYFTKHAEHQLIAHFVGNALFIVLLLGAFFAKRTLPHGAEKPLT